MNILVTGGTGFIGTVLMQQLEDKGHNPIAFDIAENADYDILDKHALIDAIKNWDIDVVMHLAAIADLNWAAKSLENTEQCLDINILGTQNVALACQQTGTRMIYISTVCVYGNQEKHPTTEESLPNPAEIYAESKLAGEAIIKGISKSWGLRYNIARIATVYGYGQRPALGTWIFMNQAFLGSDITVHGSGEQERTLTHVEDISSGLIAILEKGQDSETYNVTQDQPVTAVGMAEMIRDAVGSKSKIIHIDQRENQVYREEISYAKLHEHTGWEPRFKEFKEGIEYTINQYRDEYSRN